MGKLSRTYSHAYYYWMKYLEPIFALAIIALGTILAMRVAVMYSIFAILGIWAFFRALEKRKEVEKPS